jgi:hypothetical protein
MFKLTNITAIALAGVICAAALAPTVASARGGFGGRGFGGGHSFGGGHGFGGGGFGGGRSFGGGGFGRSGGFGHLAFNRGPIGGVFNGNTGRNWGRNWGHNPPIGFAEASGCDLHHCPPTTPPNNPPCLINCGGHLPPPIVWWKHHPHWGVVEYQAALPVGDVATPVAADAVAAGPCNCLTKQYLDDGSVLFKDICTKEAALATPEELKAQAQGAAPQAQAN